MSFEEVLTHLRRVLDLEDLVTDVRLAYPLLVAVFGLPLGAWLIYRLTHPLRRRSDDPLAGERRGK